MRRTLGLRKPRSPRLGHGRRVLLCAATLSALAVGCATSATVVSDCPAPSPDEAMDISDWLMETPERPAQMWAARVIGRIYADELREVRGEN